MTENAQTIRKLGKRARESLGYLFEQMGVGGNEPIELTLMTQARVGAGEISERELKLLPNVGHRTVGEIKGFLAEHGISLPEDSARRNFDSAAAAHEYLSILQPTRICPHCTELMQTIVELRQELGRALSFQAIHDPPTVEQLEYWDKHKPRFETPPQIHE